MGDGHSKQADQCQLHNRIYALYPAHTDGAAANPMPEIARARKDGSAVESTEQRDKQEGVWGPNEGYTVEKTE